MRESKVKGMDFEMTQSEIGSYRRYEFPFIEI
jgi:hypothetical protein